MKKIFEQVFGQQIAADLKARVDNKLNFVKTDIVKADFDLPYKHIEEEVEEENISDGEEGNTSYLLIDLASFIQVEEDGEDYKDLQYTIEGLTNGNLLPLLTYCNETDIEIVVIADFSNDNVNKTPVSKAIATHILGSMGIASEMNTIGITQDIVKNEKLIVFTNQASDNIYSTPFSSSSDLLSKEPAKGKHTLDDIYKNKEMFFPDMKNIVVLSQQKENFVMWKDKNKGPSGIMNKPSDSPVYLLSTLKQSNFIERE